MATPWKKEDQNPLGQGVSLLKYLFCIQLFHPTRLPRLPHPAREGHVFAFEAPLALRFEIHGPASPHLVNRKIGKRSSDFGLFLDGTGFALGQYGTMHRLTD